MSLFCMSIRVLKNFINARFKLGRGDIQIKKVFLLEKHYSHPQKHNISLSGFLGKYVYQHTQ